METDEGGRKRGGGPRSREGKARASLNALRHGLTAAVPRLLEWESAAKFRELRDALIAELQPDGVVESLLVDRILWCAWRLGRAARVEQLLLMGDSFEPGPALVRWVDPDQPEPEATADSEAAERERAESAALVNFGVNASQLTRYETTLERSMYRAIWELRETQSARRERDKGPKAGPGFRAA